jgi:hypothetical protein
VLRWAVFCHVIDNFGDLGVCLRAARALCAREGDQVTLFCTDLALGHKLIGEEVIPRFELKLWSERSDEAFDVVLETFGCRAPSWAKARLVINLEYLSAEAYAERSHGLASPRADGVPSYFFYPGFFAPPRTGGLLLDQAPGLASSTSVFAFTYPHAQLGSLEQACTQSGRKLVQPKDLGWLKQAEFDQALSSHAMLIVRGEDSFVQAQSLGLPFVWHIYRQEDGAHWPKLEAFFDEYSKELGEHERAVLWRVWKGFNSEMGASVEDWTALFDLLPELREHALRWRERLHAMPHLSANLRTFALSKL